MLEIESTKMYKITVFILNSKDQISTLAQAVTGGVQISENISIIATFSLSRKTA